ncbi:MAG: c-type cytochrome [Hyphomicrobiaceae bacterium]
MKRIFSTHRQVAPPLHAGGRGRSGAARRVRIATPAIAITAFAGIASVAAVVGIAVSSPTALANARLAQAQSGGDAAAARSKIIVSGPVRASAGETARLPVSLAADGQAGGRYVVVLDVPHWLSFDRGEQIGNGVWLIEHEKIASVAAAFSAAATGAHDLTIGLGGKTGAIDHVTTLRVEVAPKRITTGAIPAAADDGPATLRAPAPVPALRLAEAQAAASAPAAKPIEVRTAQAQGEAGGAGGFTWEKLISGDKPAGGAAPAKPAAAPAPKAPSGATRSEAELIQDAKHLVRECTTCHNLYGSDVGIPVMVGLTVDRFIDTMDLYKREKRDHKLMQVIAKSLTDEETRALALYLSRIKPAVQDTRTPASGSQLPESPVDTARAAQEPVAITLKRITDDKSRDRVARWLQRGEAMLKAGDISQARLLLQRASEFGDPRAAFLMATSFDPNALPWRPGTGMVAEPLMARRWYLLAKSLGGGGEVDTRLADLPAPQ